MDENRLGRFRAGDEERHVERLARLESTIAGMRDFLTQRMNTNQAHRLGPNNLVKILEYIRVVKEDIAAIRNTDQDSTTSQIKMRELWKLVWEAFERLQNPTDCKSARKLRCNLTDAWGFVSGAHHMLWCFVAALQMDRTLILDTSEWHYYPSSRNWSTVFQPVTGPSCDGVDIDKETIIFTRDDFPGSQVRGRLVDLPVSIVNTLVAYHADPYAWWYGQIMGYIFRFQDCTHRTIESFKKEVGYKHPIVSMLIQRSDKRLEAEYHTVSEYMKHAEEFYTALASNGVAIEKRVFVATDEPSVIKEIQVQYPSFVVIANRNASTEASSARTRYATTTLESHLIDLHLLAESDHLVCAFSSGFCRLAYELMHARHAQTGADATRKVTSVDLEYHYAFVPFPPRRILYENRVAFGNEMNWSHPGGLVGKKYDKQPIWEAKEKKYADGFDAVYTEDSTKEMKMMVFPRFKTVQTYSVACYSAFNDSIQKM